MQPYANFTDDQLAEWHMNMKRIDQLASDLTASRAATIAVQAGAEVERAKLRAELLRHAEDVIELTRKHADQQSANRRLCGQQVQLAKALRALRDLVMEGKVSNDSIEWPGEVFRAVQDAEEVLSLVEVPFG